MAKYESKPPNEAHFYRELESIDRNSEKIPLLGRDSYITNSILALIGLELAKIVDALQSTKEKCDG